MNASMAKRIRNAEALLISAIDRRNGGWRAWSHNRAQPHLREPRFSAPVRSESLSASGSAVCEDRSA